ncbi:helix-turn-helix domain-containing protein [Rhodoblastus sp.]|uniref:helix-turn-helix domain-containing protein n=1 Tax=Rhodoblastus sp. TaxID=1962975 RepID=UPI003F9C4EFC
MLADQFHTAVAAARNGPELVDLARGLWRAHAEGRLADADAQAVSEAIEARKAAPTAKAAGEGPRLSPKAASGRRRPARRREKMFGVGRPRALDRNAKARIMHLARCRSRRTEKGKAYGVVTAKHLAVLEALLWGFHNAKSGLCFPSYERIAEAAHCAASTVGEAIKALEAAGLMTWVNRLKRVRERCADLLGADGWRWRVMRTSNAYEFLDPGAPDARPDPSKSENPAGTGNQDLPFLKNPRAEAARALMTGAAMQI